MPGQTPQSQYQAPKTVQYRQFKGMNTTDARTAIDDDELAWLESVMPIGNGALQIVPGYGASVDLIGVTGVNVFGFTLNGAAVMIIVGADGSLTQATPGGVVTAIAPAGTVSTLAHCSIWQSSPILIVDPTFGYMTWDGTTFAVLDASKLGESIAVFEGRVWIGHNRTIQFTAPASFSDFTAGNGAGSSIITDEAFQGNIIAMVSSQEQLWILGQAAIDALSNVQASGVAPNVVTTFSVTNIVTNIGTNSPLSVVGYLRALTFLSPFGVYALSGVTPQKLSAKLDGLFKSLDLTSGDSPGAVVEVNGLLVLCFLVRYNGPDANPYWAASGGTLPLHMLLCFVEGKWFVHVLASGLQPATGLTTVVVNGVPQLWTVFQTGGGGAGNSLLIRVFGDETQRVQYLIRSKFFDFGAATTMKQLYKVGFEFQASAQVQPAMTIDSEGGSTPITVTNSNTYTLINSVGGVLQLQNSLGQNLNLVGQGLVMTRTNGNFNGRYLGWTIGGAAADAADVAYRVSAVQLEYAMSKEWWAP